MTSANGITFLSSRFSAKDEKPYVPSHSTYVYPVVMGRKRTPPHCSKRKGDVDPGGVANLFWAALVICKERSLKYRDNFMILPQVS